MGKIAKIINGRRYDYSTASLLLWHCAHRGSFDYVDEGLYRKRNGEYFLAGEGGPMSHYSRSSGQNSWSGGEGVIPLSEDEAKEYVENYGEVDDYDRIFGYVSDADPALFTFDLPSDLRDKLKSAVARGDYPTMSAAVIAALRAF